MPWHVRGKAQEIDDWQVWLEVVPTDISQIVLKELVDS